MEAKIKENASLKATLTAGKGTQIIKEKVNDYNELVNKPKINHKELVGDMDSSEFVEVLTNLEIEALIQGIT